MPRSTESSFSPKTLEALANLRDEAKQNEENILNAQVEETAEKLVADNETLTNFLNDYKEHGAAWVIVGMQEDLETVQRIVEIEKEKPIVQKRLEDIGGLENLIRNYAEIARNNLEIAQTFANALQVRINTTDILLDTIPAETNQTTKEFKIVKGMVDTHQFVNNCFLRAVFEPITGETIKSAQHDFLAATTIVRDYENHSRPFGVDTDENSLHALFHLDPKKYFGYEKTRVVIRPRDVTTGEKQGKAGIRYTFFRKGKEALNVRWDMDNTFTLDVCSDKSNDALKMVMTRMQRQTGAGHHIRKFDESLTPDDFANVATAYRNLREEFKLS